VSTIIESVIKTNPLGRWYIELMDTMKDESDENRIICLDVFEYAQKIEVLSKEYEGELEIAWSSEDDVSLAQINEVRQQIMAYEAEIEAKQQEATHMPDGTPNFSQDVF